MVRLSWLPKFTHLIGIDFGTQYTRIWSDSKGMVINEPTVIATDQNNKVIAVGTDAAEMAGRVTQGITLHQPVQHGRLYDASIAKALLRVWLQEVLGIQYLLSPVVMVSVPVGATQAAQQAIVELMYDLGAREVFVIAQPLAAAIGAGVPIADASGTLLFQLGAGVVEAAMISLGSVVASQTSDKAGEYIDSRVQFAVKQYHGVIISQHTAEELKWVAPVVAGAEGQQLVMGQEAGSNAPIEVNVPVATFSLPVQQIAAQYLKLVQKLLSQVPPELTGDVLDKGMLLAGGLAQLPELDQWLTEELGIPVTVVEEPELVVIKGISTALEHRNEFKQSLGYR